MSRWNENKVAKKLQEYAETEPVEPPKGLLEKIQAEIPATLPVPANVDSPDLGETGTGAGPRRWLIAASILAMLGAGVLGLRVSQRAPEMEEVADLAQEEAESAPEAAAEDVEREQAEEPPVYDATAGEADGAVAQDAPMPILPRVQGVQPAKPQDLDVEYPASPPPPPAAYPAPKERRRYQEDAVTETISTSSESSVRFEGKVEQGVEGGVVGGVAGGVVGGSPGGVVSGAPLRVGGTTGGNAEPNDEPYGDVFFKSAGTNPFIDTEDDRLSTFGLDVDTGSYTVARRYLRDGNLPPAEAIRVEEFLNYFDYRDRPPVKGDFALRAEGAPSPFAQGERYQLVRFSIRGREVKAENRKPAVLVFVVDVSGSMDMENRLGLVKQSLGMLLDELRPTDRIGLVVYGDQARLLLEPTSDRNEVRRAIEALRPEGSTNAQAGLSLGYDVASRHFRSGSINRIILCSDGVANVGLTGASSILDRIGREARRGIELTTLGFGMGNFNDVLMEQLANKGDGRYAYVDDIEEAERVLVEELTGTLQTIAKDAKVQVEFNPEVVARYRLLGYENRDIADERFRDDSVDAGEVGSGHNVTALYEVKLQPGASERATLATLRLRYRDTDDGDAREVEHDARLADFANRWEKAPASLRLASLVAEFAEILKGSYWAKDGDLDEVLRGVRKVSDDLPGDRKVADLVDLVGKAARIKNRAE